MKRPEVDERDLAYALLEPTRPRRTHLGVDRTDPVWQRLRGACCDESSWAVDVDEHADLVYATVVALKDGLFDERHDADANLPQGVPVPLVEQPSSSCHLEVEDAALSRRSRRFESGQERFPSPVGGDRDVARTATPAVPGKATP